MTSARCAVLVSGLLLLTLNSSAQVATTQVAQSSPAAISALQGSLAAMGAGSLGTISSLQLTVNVTDSTGNGSTGTITTQGVNNLRMESGSSVTVSDGTKVLLQSDGGTATHLSQPALSEIGFTHIPVLSYLGNWSQLGMILSAIGTETLSGRSVYHIQYQQQIDQQLGGLSAPCDVFIDAQTHFIDRLTYVVRTPSNLRQAAVITVDYGNYQAISGVMVPFTVTYSIDGNSISTQTVTTFEINIPINSSLFQIE
jgi:hypothetical protein